MKLVPVAASGGHISVTVTIPESNNRIITYPFPMTLIASNVFTVPAGRVAMIDGRPSLVFDLSTWQLADMNSGRVLPIGYRGDNVCLDMRGFVEEYVRRGGRNLWGPHLESFCDDWRKRTGIGLPVKVVA